MSGIDNFYGQSMKTLSNKCLQRIIHKPVFGYPAEVIKGRTAYAHPKVCSLARAVRTRVTCVVSAFVNYVQKKRLEFVTQSLFKLRCGDVHGVSSVLASSLLM